MQLQSISGYCSLYTCTTPPRSTASVWKVCVFSFPTEPNMAGSLTTEEQRDLAQRYQGLREDINTLYSRLAGVDSDRSEHDLVLKQMEKLDGSRRCWHQVGTVLAETTVAEVVPVLKINHSQLIESVQSLTAAVQAREKQLSELTNKYGIREVDASTAAAAQS